MPLQTLGRYRIVKEIGRGAMGTVYLAHDPQLDRPVALKTVTIFASLPDGERGAARERFLREARAVGKLLHPRIVTIFDAGEADGVPYLAMEYVDGTPLDRYGAGGERLPLPLTVALTIKAAEALAEAHAAGIVHRDVKPANLLRVAGDEIKILDFGLAKGAAAQVTQDGALLGTPSYMAPEQVRGDAVDGRTDLFALAVVLFELATGEKPFAGESVSSVLYRIVHEEPQDPAGRLAGLPAPLAEFLRKALAKDPADRFPDGKSFAAALRRAAAGASPPASTKPAAAGVAPAVPAREATPPASSRWPYFAGAAVVAAGALGALFFLHGRGAPAATLLEAKVETEPPGLAVLLDGKPLATERVTFPASGPYGTLTAATGCRTVSHTLAPSDAGGEIVLAPEATRAELEIDPGVPGAQVRLAGAELGQAPVRVSLDLCVENRLETTAEGYAPAAAVIPAGATLADARAAAASLRLRALPTGSLELPRAPYRVAFTIDGRAVAGPRLEVPQGKHRLRATDDERFVDVAIEVEVGAGAPARPALRFPPLGVLAVQAFPPDGKVYVRKPGGAWRFVDDVPARVTIAAGAYDVKVDRGPGDSRETRVELRAGENPPVRFSFGGSR